MPCARCAITEVAVSPSHRHLADSLSRSRYHGKVMRIHALVRASLGAFALMMFAAGCRDLAHVNPYDPDAPFLIVLTGPAVMVAGDTATFLAATNPVWRWEPPP